MALVEGKPTVARVRRSLVPLVFALTFLIGENMSTNNKKQISPLLLAAIQYAVQGWCIVPLHSFFGGGCTCEKPGCGSPAKHPLTPNGVHAATTDETTIRRWWAEAQGLANVGIATGQNSGLVVVDVDAKSGGIMTISRLENAHGKLPRTPTAETGGGGRHYYFRYPDGECISNRAGILPGIDVRGDGGYVVAPPSRHVSGNHYAWAVPPETPLADLPAWLLELIVGKSFVGADVLPLPACRATTLVVQPATDDLATHPGSSEGKRNATLCTLAGAHLARSEDAKVITALALAWAERCSPPMPQGEVIRTIKSLSEKHQQTTLFVRAQANGDGGDFEQLPLPESPPWPALGEAAYHGLAGEIIRTLEPESEADPIAILLSFIVCFGNIVGRTPHYLVEGDKHHGNLFLTLVGASGTGRKGTSLGRVLQLFDGVEDWSKSCLSTGLSSGEGLIWAVRDRIEGMEPIKEQGKIVGYQDVVRDAGVEDKRLLVIEPELAQALRVLSREGNTLSPTLRAAWDRGDLRTLTKNNQSRATDAHISILGHITLPELNKYLRDTEMFNGFANRFLWGMVKRSKLLPDGGKELDLQPLKQRLAEAYKVASRIEQMTRSPAAQELWRSLYPALTAGGSGLAAAATGRGEAQTLRLSLLYALLDGKSVIDVPHLQAAHAVWCYCRSSAHIIFCQAQEDPLERLLLNIIGLQPGINRKGLHKATGGHLPAAALMAALVAVRDRGLVRCETAATGGRPAERWYPSCERTNKGSGNASAVGSGLSSFARNQPSVAAAAAAVDTDGKSLPTKVEAAAATHAVPLAAVASAESPFLPEAENKPWITEQEFFAAVRTPEGLAKLRESRASKASPDGLMVGKAK
jgi:hypothetical protein